MLKVITAKAATPADAESAVGATLDELARAGAQRMIAAALQLEVAEYVARFRAARDEAGMPWSCATGRRARGRSRRASGP